MTLLREFCEILRTDRETLMYLPRPTEATLEARTRRAVGATGSFDLLQGVAIDAKTAMMRQRPGLLMFKGMLRRQSIAILLSDRSQ